MAPFVSLAPYLKHFPNEMIKKGDPNWPNEIYAMKHFSAPNNIVKIRQLQNQIGDHFKRRRAFVRKVALAGYRRDGKVDALVGVQRLMGHMEKGDWSSADYPPKTLDVRTRKEEIESCSRFSELDRRSHWINL